MNWHWHKNRSTSSFITFDLLSQELLAFVKKIVSGLFSTVFWDLDVKFGIWIAFNLMQIKFKFCHAWPILTGVIALCLDLVSGLFFLQSFEILTLNLVDLLSSHYTNQVRLLSLLTYFHLSYCPNLQYLLVINSSNLHQLYILTWSTNATWWFVPSIYISRLSDHG